MTAIQQLSDALASFPGVTIIESDPGGDTEQVHPGKRMDMGFGTWYIRFAIERTAQGWDTLEELSYIVNNTMQLSGARFFILPYAFAPNEAPKGESGRLCYVLEGGKVTDLPWLVEYLKKERSSKPVTV